MLLVKPDRLYANFNEGPMRKLLLYKTVLAYRRHSIFNDMLKFYLPEQFNVQSLMQYLEYYLKQKLNKVISAHTNPSGNTQVNVNLTRMLYVIHYIKM